MATEKNVDNKPKNFFEKLKAELKKVGAEALADSLKIFSGVKVPNNPAAMKEALDSFFKKAFAEITVETKSGRETFVCCSNYEFVKQFSRGKRLQPPQELGSDTRDPFKTRSRTMVLTWDLLNNKFVSFKTDKPWEITGMPIIVPENITPRLAEVLREILLKLFIAERK